MMKQRHLEEAEAMMPDSFAEHSSEYLDGYRYALAWRWLASVVRPRGAASTP